MRIPPWVLGAFALGCSASSDGQNGLPTDGGASKGGQSSASGGSAAIDGSRAGASSGGRGRDAAIQGQGGAAGATTALDGGTGVGGTSTGGAGTGGAGTGGRIVDASVSGDARPVDGGDAAARDGGQCAPLEKRCTSGVPEACSAAGQWVGQGACGGGDPRCVDGTCVQCATVGDCTPSSNDCLTPACSAAHTCEYVQKSTGAACGGGAGSCDAGGQCNLCQPGARTCNGNVPLLCDSTGQFAAQPACGGGRPFCDQQTGACVACTTAQDCPTPSSTCLVATCTANVCEAQPVTEGTACAGGACNAAGACWACQPGTTACSGTAVLSCNTKGQYDPPAACLATAPYCDPATHACVQCTLASQCAAPGECFAPTCSGGTCSSAPKPASTVCGGGAARCDGAGQCNACQPGTRTCSGGVPEICGSNGQYAPQTPCSGATPVCDPATGTCVGCTSVADCPTPPTSCLVATCTGSTCGTTSVAQGTACNGGTCNGSGSCWACTPSTKACSGNSVLTCGANGQYGAPTACTALTPYCDAATSACVQCASAAQCTAPGECYTATCSATACGSSPKALGATCGGGAGQCDGSGQCNVCQPGTRTCNGNVPQLCNGSGQYTAQAACAGAAPICDLATGTCVSCVNAAQCPAPSGTCAVATCTNNACGTVPLAQGTACTGGTCNGSGACWACTPTTKTCSGDAVLTCGGNGQYGAPVACGGATPYCAAATAACVGCTSVGQCAAPANPCLVAACSSNACGTAPAGSGALCPGGTCGGGTCTCSAGSANCDLNVANGCEVDLGTSTANCGACGTACTNANGTTVCTAGKCVPTCAAGHGDCDGKPENGCERDISTLSDCGGCGTVCDFANAGETCVGGVCSLGACAAGFGNCNGLATDGCETDLATTTAHCGACPVACTNANGSTSCIGGACAPACSGGFTSCDSNAQNGCETNTGGSVTSCGGCGTICSAASATPSCTNGACGFTCNAGFADCDLLPGNGCEASLATTAHCGSCGKVCTNANGGTSCVAGACVPTCLPSYASCDGNPDNGCEKHADTLADCGGCGVPCARANAGESCPAGVCTLGACDPNFGNCDSLAPNGCEVDLRTDPTHCGTCPTVCNGTNGTPGCTLGVCSIACNVGFADCDLLPGTGCEASLATAAHCGTCSKACTNANGGTSCVSGACIPTCLSPYASCDGNPDNGCELRADTLTDCGGCGVPCARANAGESCPGGVCTLGTCDPGFGNCDTLAPNGCEVDLGTSLTHCGNCATVCNSTNGTPSCALGACSIACSAGFANCDNLLSTGCEVTLATATANCGACGTACANANGTTSCVGGLCKPVCTGTFGDCDSNAVNGCETDLGTDSANCGVCGTVCTGGKTCVGGVCGVGPTCTAGANGKLPNVVMIVSDDLDQASLDLLLANGKLPNIQNYIINHGTRFTQSYVGNALCGPSRATFLTGQYSHNNLVSNNANCMTQFAPHAASTIATAMKTAGYRTGYFGKYLNGYGPNTYHAPGWDEWQVMTDATVYWLWGFTLVKYITPAATTTLVQYGGGSTARSATDYQTDVLASLGSTFINTWADTSGTKPFFLVEMPLAPHVEVLPGQSFNSYTLELQLRTRPANKYYGTLRKTLAGGGVDDYTPISPAFELPKFSAPSFNETDVTDKPSWVSAWPVMDATNINYQRRQYLDRLEAILSVDDMVGTIYAALTAKGVVDNTLVLLTGDNGFMLGEHRLNNKMFPYEESIRVPLIASCGAATGVVEDRFVSNIDLAPTIADYGKAATLANADGRSFRGILERASVASWRSRVMVEHWFNPGGALFNDCPDHALVRTSSSEATPNHKYVEYYGTSGTINQTSVPNDFEEYDLPADPYEVQSVGKSASYATQRAALAPKLQSLRTCAGATCRTAEN